MLSYGVGVDLARRQRSDTFNTVNNVHTDFRTIGMPSENILTQLRESIYRGGLSGLTAF